VIFDNFACARRYGLQLHLGTLAVIGLMKRSYFKKEFSYSIAEVRYDPLRNFHRHIPLKTSFRKNRFKVSKMISKQQ